MRWHKPLAAYALFVILVVAFAPHLKGQTAAEINGLITDASSAVVPQAKVVATMVSSGVQTTVFADAAGLYHLGPLHPGIYSVEVTKVGFKTFVASNLELTSGNPTRLDITLQVGQVSQSVTVSADVTQLNTSTTSTNTLIGATYVKEMPLVYRRPAQLTLLAPAVTYVSTDPRSYYNPFIAEAGNGDTSNQYYIDGGNASNTRVEQEGLLDFNPSVDVVQEYRILQTNHAAEYGGGGGMVVLMTTKQGSNAFHGSAYWFGRNDALDARNFFATNKNELRKNIWGGTLGGPIKKDRAFFFGSYEGDTLIQGSPGFDTVPTLAERNGDFSALGKSIYDPFSTTVGAGGAVTRTAFAGNMIPQSRWDPVAAKVLSFWPTPNLAGTPNYFGEAKSTERRKSVTGRVDVDINSRNRVYGRALLDWPWFIDRGIFPNSLQDADPSDWRTPTNSFNYLGAWTRTLGGGHAVNEFVFTYSQREWGAKSPSSGKDYPKQFGLPVPVVNSEPIPAAPETPASSGPHVSFPTFNLENYTGLGHGWNSGGGFQKPMRNFHLRDTYSFLRGTHSFKTGFETRRSTADYLFAPFPVGNYSFNSRPTAANASDTKSGDGFASFLLGWPGSAYVQDVGERTVLSWYYGAFFQDDWHIRPTVTLNLGIRYDVDTPLTELSNPPKVVGFNPGAINPVCQCPGTITFPTRFHNGDYNNFAPRVGIVWNPKKGSNVIRLAYGIYYGAPYVNSIWGLPGVGRPDVTRAKSVSSPDNGITAPFLLRNGIGTIPPFDASQLNSGFGAVPIGQAPTTDPQFYEPSRPNPYNEMVTVSFQHQLPRDMVLEVDYLGNWGRKLNTQTLEINQVPPALMGPGNAQLLRPFPQFSGLQDVSMPYGVSSYDALVVRVDKRFNAGLAFQANYTYSNFKDNISSVSSYYNRAGDWGPSTYDRRNRFVLSGVWETPIGAGRKYKNSGVAAHILGGWNLGAIVTAQAGQPFTVTMTQNLCNCFSAGPIRPDVTGSVGGPKTIQQWFNTGAFTNAAPYTFGNENPNLLVGPGLFNIDTSLIKTFRLKESSSFEIRGEFFNLFNHANFANPNAALGSPTFGQIRSAQDGRIIQVGAKITF